MLKDRFFILIGGLRKNYLIKNDYSMSQKLLKIKLKRKIKEILNSKVLC